MIRSILTVAALGFALVGCTSGSTTEAPGPVAPPAAPAPAIAPAAPAVEPAPAVEQPVTEPSAVVEQNQKQSPALTCEPYADARFDPNNPNVIVNKACGYTDAQGQERSHNPWMDDQLTSARESAQQQVEQAKAQVPDMPMPPSVSSSEPGYEQQMDTYRQQVNQYMCSEGNAYTVPSNQRSC